MTDEKKQKAEEQKRKALEFHAGVGRIAVEAEQLNNMMAYCCKELLCSHGLPSEYAATVVAGMNLENTRRLWLSLMKLALRDQPVANEMIDHLGSRIDNVTKRRGDVIHGLWFVGRYGSHLRYDEPTGSSIGKEIRPKEAGGVRYTKREAKDFKTIIDELMELSAMLLVIARLGIDFVEHLHFQDKKLIRRIRLRNLERG